VLLPPLDARVEEDMLASMHRLALVIALVALGCSLYAVAQSGASHPVLAADAPAAEAAWRAERNYPPLVFSGQAWLECAISSTIPGRQAMHTVSGQGFNFEMEMLPIKDGLVQLRNPGMMYKFNAFPRRSVKASLSGIGEGMIAEMKAEVEVQVDRFSQPRGPGTEIAFNAADVNDGSAYIEFTGVFVRGGDKKRFPFRVLFSAVRDGAGRVMPGPEIPPAGFAPGIAHSTFRLMSKMVTIGSSAHPATVTTALYEAEDDVPVLR
jgi:hypothetical protein